MAITLATGTQAAIVSGVEGLFPHIPNTGAFAYSKDDPGESILTNVLAPLDQPNSLRFSSTEVADIFKNSPTAPAAGQSTRGLHLLTQVNEVWKCTDSVSGETWTLPVSAHLVLKLPIDAEVTAARCVDLLRRLMGALWGTKDASAASMNEYAEAIAPVLRGITRL